MRIRLAGTTIIRPIERDVDIRALPLVRKRKTASHHSGNAIRSGIEPNRSVAKTGFAPEVSEPGFIGQPDPILIPGLILLASEGPAKPRLYSEDLKEFARDLQRQHHVQVTVWLRLKAPSTRKIPRYGGYRTETKIVEIAPREPRALAALPRLQRHKLTGLRIRCGSAEEWTRNREPCAEKCNRGSDYEGKRERSGSVAEPQPNSGSKHSHDSISYQFSDGFSSM